MKAFVMVIGSLFWMFQLTAAGFQSDFSGMAAAPACFLQDDEQMYYKMQTEGSTQKLRGLQQLLVTKALKRFKAETVENGKIKKARAWSLLSFSSGILAALLLIVASWSIIPLAVALLTFAAVAGIVGLSKAKKVSNRKLTLSWAAGIGLVLGTAGIALILAAIAYWT